MRYEFSSTFGWSKGISTNHDIELDLGLRIEDFLKGRNISVTLAGNQGLIRKEIQRIVIEEILPKVFLEAGVTPVEGELNTKQHSKIKGRARMIERHSGDGIDVEIRDRLSVIMNITTDKPVTALEAAHGSNIAIADAITNDIMMHLAHKYFGITDHNISTDSSVKNGKLADHTGKNTGNSESQN